MVAVPVAVGAYAWSRRPDERFGRLLMLAGFGWFLTTLAESGDELLYSIGRVSGWALEVLLIYLVLSFPTGRITERVDRALVWAGAGVVVLLYLPSALLADAYPSPSPWSSCVRSCPGNAFMVPGTEPAWVDAAVRPLRETITLLLFGVVLVRLALRVRRATPLLRRTLNPVLVVAIFRMAALVGAIVSRAAGPDTTLTRGLTWVAALALPTMAAGFGIGLIRHRILIADAVGDLGSRMQAGIRPSDLGDALASVLRDPSLRLVYLAPVERPPRQPGRYVTEVRSGDRMIALIDHDEALLHQPKLLEAACALTRIALENERLAAEVTSSLAEIDKSRGRIQAAADEERQRIERDLHDGAQQRLVALRVKLELAEELVREDPARGLPRLHVLGDEVTDALDDIRSIARGVYPSLLAERGLPEALQAAALRAPTETHVGRDGVGRYPQSIESAVYFCCLEALQNAAKHAPGATGVTIDLHEDGGLRFEVTDDGEGFDVRASAKGTGLTNMRDRLEAVGGTLVIRSEPGQGSVISGSIPLP
jgi:signal transduction histidine kinase